MADLCQEYLPVVGILPETGEEVTVHVLCERLIVKTTGQPVNHINHYRRHEHISGEKAIPRTMWTRRQ